jgi:hypothetical protein
MTAFYCHSERSAVEESIKTRAGRSLPAEGGPDSTGEIQFTIHEIRTHFPLNCYSLGPESCR